MTVLDCVNCSATDNKGGPWWHVRRISSGDASIDVDVYLCSESCLNEWVWKQRESNPKLSKSKATA